jgi:hypothetical protein
LGQRKAEKLTEVCCPWRHALAGGAHQLGVEGGVEAAGERVSEVHGVRAKLEVVMACPKDSWSGSAMWSSWRRLKRTGMARYFIDLQWRIVARGGEHWGDDAGGSWLAAPAACTVAPH